MIEQAIKHYLERTGFSEINLRAALIDMDGTLYDSMPRHAEAWMRMVSEIGIHAQRSEFFEYEGRTGASTINILFRRAYGRDATPEEAEQLYHRKTEIFAALPDVGPMPGARQLTAEFVERGLTCVLVTGSGQNTLLNRINADYPGVFAPDMRVTSRSVAHGKPHPEPFLMGMQLAGVEPWQAIVIENAPLGVQAGVAAKAFTVAVNTGPISAQLLHEAGADIVFPTMQACADAMPQILLLCRNN